MSTHEHPPLTRKDLDHGVCEKPGCDHTAHDGLYLHSRCHPDQGTRVEYRANSGTITVRCNECHDEIVRIAVAPGPQLEPVIGYEACWTELAGTRTHCRKPKGHDGPHAYI